MRFEKPENLLRLALMMQGNYEGVSLADIMAEFEVSRRTAERMRDAVQRVFPQMDETLPTGDRIKRWRIPQGTLNEAIGFSADELCHLGTAITVLREQGFAPQAEILSALAAKLKALMPRTALARIEPDFEAMAEAEGLAWRPGPRPLVDADLLRTLREAIKRPSTVRFTYDPRHGGKAGSRTVCPLGLLYGTRPFLVARTLRNRRIVTYALDGIEDIEITGNAFSRDPAFSLRAWAAESFGTYREDDGPFDVAWRFTPAAAENAREWLFHPDQTLEEQPDGSLIVRFRAYDLKAMAHHVLTWEGELEVQEPERLRSYIFRLTEKARPDGC